MSLKNLKLLVFVLGFFILIAIALVCYKIIRIQQNKTVAAIPISSVTTCQPHKFDLSILTDVAHIARTGDQILILTKTIGTKQEIIVLDLCTGKVTHQIGLALRFKKEYSRRNGWDKGGSEYSKYKKD